MAVTRAIEPSAEYFDKFYPRQQYILFWRFIINILPSKNIKQTFNLIMVYYTKMQKVASTVRKN